MLETRDLESAIKDLLSRIQALSAELSELKAADSASTSPAWTAPTLSNSWVDYDGSHTAAYTKNNGLVRTQGWLKNGALGSAAFTLPSGYRPAQDLRWIAYSSTAAGTIGVLRINTNGEVIPSAPGDNGHFSIDGIVFFSDGS